MVKRLLSCLVLPLAVGIPAAGSCAALPPEPDVPWTIRVQGQPPVIEANHAVGGFGLALAGEKGAWAVIGEAQLLPIVVCDSPCGSAYSAGVGVAFQPTLGRGVSGHLELLARYYAQPSLRQYVPAIGPRVGLRWPEQGAAVSLDAGISFVTAHNFDSGGFATKRGLGLGIPEMVLGLWF